MNGYIKNNYFCKYPLDEFKKSGNDLNKKIPDLNEKCVFFYFLKSRFLPTVIRILFEYSNPLFPTNPSSQRASPSDSSNWFHLSCLRILISNQWGAVLNFTCILPENARILHNNCPKYFSRLFGRGEGELPSHLLHLCRLCLYLTRKAPLAWSVDDQRRSEDKLLHFSYRYSSLCHTLHDPWNGLSATQGVVLMRLANVQAILTSWRQGHREFPFWKSKIPPPA